MSSLSSGLPRPAEDPTNIAFKEAALSLTNLYKASQGARREGYLDAVDEIYSLFLSGSSKVDPAALTRWIEDRRRRKGSSPMVQDDHETHDYFDTIPVPHSDPQTMEQQQQHFVATSPIRPLPPPSSSIQRHRMASPVHRHHSDDSERRDRDRDRDRVNGVKRRVVVGAVDDLHKRGRFG